MWMISCPEAMGWGFWVIFEKKAVSWDSDLGQTTWVYGMCRAFVGSVSWDPKLKASWDLKLDEASPVGSTRCAAHGGVRWNSQHSKNCVSLPSCWKPKSQEGNKSFVPELLRVVSVLSVFRIPMHMNILHIHIFYVITSGYVT